MATPGVPPGDAAYPLVKLAAIHATQLEFTRDPAAVQFLDADCVNIGGAGGVRIGIRMCVKAPAPNTSSLDAGKHSQVSSGLEFSHDTQDYSSV